MLNVLSSPHPLTSTLAFSDGRRRRTRNYRPAWMVKWGALLGYSSIMRETHLNQSDSSHGLSFLVWRQGVRDMWCWACVFLCERDRLGPHVPPRAGNASVCCFERCIVNVLLGKTCLLMEAHCARMYRRWPCVASTWPSDVLVLCVVIHAVDLTYSDCKSCR